MISVSLFATEPREEWIVDQGQRAQWDELLQKAHLTTEYVQKTLAQCQGISLEFGEPRAAEPLPAMPHTLPLPEELLWSDEVTSVYSARNPLVRNHLWVVLNRPAKGFSEIFAEEAVQMRATANKALRILRESFALPCAVMAQWNQPQADQLQERVTIELIPPHSETKEVHNILAKVDSNNHVLFRGRFPNCLPRPSQEELDKDNEIWKKALADPSPPPFQEIDRDVAEKWTQVQVHKDEAGQVLGDLFYQLLAEEGIQIERRILPHDETPDEPLISEISKCAFCLDKVLQSQMVFEGRFCSILYNYKSSILGGHFLIVSKRHIHSSDRLNEAEVQEMHILALKLAKTLEETTGRSDIRMYFQDGASVGQTVKHAHMHLMLTPHPIKFMLFAMNYDNEKTYTREEMLPFIEKIIQRLNEN